MHNTDERPTTSDSPTAARRSELQRIMQATSKAASEAVDRYCGRYARPNSDSGTESTSSVSPFDESIESSEPDESSEPRQPQLMLSEEALDDLIHTIAAFQARLHSTPTLLTENWYTLTMEFARCLFAKAVEEEYQDADA